MHLLNFFRRMLPIPAATPEPEAKPPIKPRAKKATTKKIPARKKK